MAFSLIAIATMSHSLPAHPGHEHESSPNTPQPPQHDAPSPAQAVQNFLDTLTPEAREAVTFRFDSELRKAWHYVPRRREGLKIGEMTEAQLAHHDAFLDSVLTQSGLELTRDVIQLEGILGVLTGKTGFRDPGRYFATGFFSNETGTPKSIWGWRFEGHHLSLNYTFHDGKIIGATPAFFGANPARVPRGEQEGLRIMAREEDWARELIKSLPEAQQRQAIFTDQPPRDIVTRARPEFELELGVGISADQLPATSREQLETLIRLYLDRHDPTWATQMWEDLEAAGWEHLFFAWAGGLEPGERHYYRIHGPTLLIEFDNVQGGANHIHSVLRDPRGDFGDPLLDHYQHGHPHP